jgi:23S rRNA (cytosine1962-C5)-methyltransferase
MKMIRLRAGKERSLLRRHPWIFESAIAKGGGDIG